MINLPENARRAVARAVNSVMTATYWEIGRRIVEVEQGGVSRADYGEADGKCRALTNAAYEEQSRRIPAIIRAPI